MTRRAVVHALVLALLLGVLVPTAVSAADAPMPDSIAAVGDSITQAASSAGSLGADAPQNSWSTGTSAGVNSHYLRLLAAGAPISGRSYNRSVSGAKVADLNAQMQTVVGVQPDYLTVLIGGNDLCTDTVGGMTTVADFQSRFQAAMATLTAGSPDTYVYVVSIPNVYQLWQLFRSNWWARFIWSTADICQSLLANPTSTQAVDVQRREAVRQRNIAFNAQLADVCSQFDRCLFDGNAVFNTPFTTGDVSGDYFHPSATGQAKLASATWAAGYRFTAAPPPPPPNAEPVAGFGVSCLELTCSFADASTDDGTIVSRAWDFGDGSTSTAPNPDHAYAVPGTYSVTLTVTDDVGATDVITRAVTVTEAAVVTMWVESLGGSAEITGRNTWTGSAAITVVGPDGRGLSGAIVTGTWSAGAGDTCTTDAAGACQVVSDGLNRKKVASVSFTVSGVTHATLVYDETASVTEVIVQRP